MDYRAQSEKWRTLYREKRDEVERLRAKWEKLFDSHEYLAGEAERLRTELTARVGELEALRRGDEVAVALADEVERLRADVEEEAARASDNYKAYEREKAEVERLRKLFHDTSGDRAVALADENERLRALALPYIQRYGSPEELSSLKGGGNA